MCFDSIFSVTQTYAVQKDKELSYIPIFSTITSLANLVQKCLILPLISLYDSDIIKNNPYLAHVDKKKFSKIFLLLVPGIGNIVYARMKSQKAEDSQKWFESLQWKDLQSIDYVNALIADPDISKQQKRMLCNSLKSITIIHSVLKNQNILDEQKLILCECVIQIRSSLDDMNTILSLDEQQIPRLAEIATKLLEFLNGSLEDYRQIGEEQIIKLKEISSVQQINQIIFKNIHSIISESNDTINKYISKLSINNKTNLAKTLAYLQPTIKDQTLEFAELCNGFISRILEIMKLYLTNAENDFKQFTTPFLESLSELQISPDIQCDDFIKIFENESKKRIEIFSGKNLKWDSYLQKMQLMNIVESYKYLPAHEKEISILTEKIQSGLNEEIKFFKNLSEQLKEIKFSQVDQLDPLNSKLPDYLPLETPNCAQQMEKCLPKKYPHAMPTFLSNNGKILVENEDQFKRLVIAYSSYFCQLTKLIKETDKVIENKKIFLNNLDNLL